MASSTSTLLGILHAIEAENKRKHARAVRAASQFTETGFKNGAPSTTRGNTTVNPKTSKESRGHHSNNPLSIIGNLAGDVKDAALGIPGGIVQTIEHPIATAEAIGSDYKRRYGPLFGYLKGEGDIGKFSQEMADHPLAPLLDVATVATLGGGAAAKVGQSARVAGAVSKAHELNAAKGAAQLTEKTAPLRKQVRALEEKSKKLAVDRDAAEFRVNDPKAPLEVQQSSAKVFEKHSAKVDDHHAHIDALTKQIEGHTEHYVNSDVKLTGHARMLEKLQKASQPRTRKIGGTGKSTSMKEISVSQSGNPIKRLRQNLGIAVQESRILPDRTPIIGLGQRAKKAANLEHQSHMAKNRVTQRALKTAVDGLEKVKDESPDHLAAATQAIIDGVEPKLYARTVKDTRSHGDDIQRSINDGMTQDEHHAFTQTVVEPHLSKRASELYRGVKQAFQEEALQAGRHIDDIHLQHKFDRDLIDSPAVQAIVKVQKAHAAAAEDAMKQLVRSGKLTKDQASKQAVLHLNLSRRIQGKKGWSPEEAAAHFEKAGLPAPVYNPDTLTIGSAGKREGAFKESDGSVYERGIRNASPRNMIGRHEVASRITDLKHAHLMMLSVATKIPEGKPLPKDYVWVSDTLKPTVKEKIKLGQQQMADGVPIGDDYYELLAAEHRPKSGLAISKSMQHDIVGGRRAMSEGRNQALTKGMTAWKYATLATRPGFLVTNVLSNSFMTALKSSWNFPAMTRTRAALKSGAFDEFHHSEGTTFGHSEMVQGGKNKVTKGISHAANALYKATGWHEHQMRQLLMYDTARRLPQVKAEMRRLKGGKTDLQGKTLFHAAYAAAIKKNPAIQGLVTRNMDDALGNYRYYTAGEKMLKNVSPFYSWERHSVRNIIRMFEDNPATMAILMQIGMEGDKRFKRDFGENMPEFVRSYIEDKYIKAVASHLGMGDEVNMYDFNSVNPYTTSIKVGEILGGGKQARDAAISMLGPIATGPLEEITGKSALTGAPAVSTHFGNPFLSIGERIAKQTPPYTVGELLATDKGSKKKMIPENKAQTVYRTMGLYFKNADKAMLEKMKKAQDTPKDKYGNPIKKK